MSEMCIGCGGFLPEGKADFCEWNCRKARREYVIGELKFLVGTDRPHNLARRLGYEPKSLARSLARWGEPELANLIEHDVVPGSSARNVPMVNPTRESVVTFEKRLNEQSSQRWFGAWNMSYGSLAGAATT